jgi:ATP-dependent Lhr-like helicase
VEKLRQLRDLPAEPEWQVISAADPLNLVGIITRDPRVPATRANRVLFVNGRPNAASESRSIRWLVDVDDATRQRATRLLLGPDTWRRQQLAAEFSEWSEPLQPPALPGVFPRT